MVSKYSVVTPPFTAITIGSNIYTFEVYGVVTFDSKEEVPHLQWDVQDTVDVNIKQILDEEDNRIPITQEQIDIVKNWISENRQEVDEALSKRVIL